LSINKQTTNSIHTFCLRKLNHIITCTMKFLILISSLLFSMSHAQEASEV
jgi:hypothetical protein